MKKLKITKHAKKRLTERIGINKRSTEKLSEIAYKQGLSHKDLTGILKKYIDKVYLKEKKANNIRIYGNNVYLFCDTTLITVLKLTSKLSRIAIKLSKKRESEVLNQNFNLKESCLN
jgi:hypothetical protein